MTILWHNPVKNVPACPAGVSAAQVTIQTSEASMAFLITAIGDQYLVLSGEGNLELVKEIASKVRPIAK